MCHGFAPFRGARSDIAEGHREKIKFKSDASEEYKDLVLKLLVVDPRGRLPLILIFNHPWVLNFQKKYNISKTAGGPESSDEDDIVGLSDDETVVSPKFA